jgi:hypothetical protein
MRFEALSHRLFGKVCEIGGFRQRPVMELCPIIFGHRCLLIGLLRYRSPLLHKKTRVFRKSPPAVPPRQLRQRSVIGVEAHTFWVPRLFRLVPCAVPLALTTPV